MYRLTIIILATGCVAACIRSPEVKESFNEGYTELAPHIIERNFSSIKLFTSHDKEEVSSLAWRALAKSTPDDLSDFVDEVLRIDTNEAWFALSFQSLDDGHLDLISEAYSAGRVESEGVCEVFFRHGTAEHLDLLLSDIDILQNNEVCALAVGGILTRTAVEEDKIKTIFETAYQTDDFIIRRNLLYGFYRGRLNTPEPGSAYHPEFLQLWENSGIGLDAQFDQYMIRTLGNEAINRIFETYHDRDLNEKIQLAIELAQNLDENVHDKQQIERFLYHPNPHVVIAMLETLHNFSSPDPDLLAEIEAEFTVRSRNHEVFVASLELLQKHGVPVENYRHKLEFTENENIYLTNRVLALYKGMDSETEYLSRLREKMEHEDIRGFHGANALSEFWFETEAEEHRDQIRQILFDQLKAGNRSAIDGLSALLSDDSIIADGDFDRFTTLFSDFRERGEDENARVMATALQERFPNRFDGTYETDVTFRIPDWEQLSELGNQPVWVLETEKGKIEILLDPISAPFAVSSTDSLTRAGVYDGVAFHRVVKNFVIQGGDFERRDGFGGPEYTIPTEPSFSSFKRGAVGIASSGTDTEGGQYFIMHQWAPHLDGHYTLFGQVIRGMDVVDRIQVGDRVLQAEIY